MITQTKQDIAARVANKIGVKQKIAAMVIDAFLDEIQTTCYNDQRVELRKFGVFSSVYTAEKIIRNVNNGELMTIPKKKKVKFNPSKILNRKINEK